MTKKVGNYVYEIDRDDLLSDWLNKNNNYNGTQDLFFEFSFNSYSKDFKLVAGIDYYSQIECIYAQKIMRHEYICNKLGIPYFVFFIGGKEYVQDGIRLRKIGYYKLNYCNKLAENFIKKHSFLYSFINEQKYSDFLHLLRGEEPEPVKDENYEIYDCSLPYKKIFRERHAKYGAKILQSDIDLILYSNKNEFEPVMIVEFKSNASFHNSLIDTNQPGQAALLDYLENRLGIPVVRIWHNACDVNYFVIKKSYGGKPIDSNIFKQLGFTGEEMAQFFWNYTFNH